MSKISRFFFALFCVFSYSVFSKLFFQVLECEEAFQIYFLFFLLFLFFLERREEENLGGEKCSMRTALLVPSEFRPFSSTAAAPRSRVEEVKTSVEIAWTTKSQEMRSHKLLQMKHSG